MARPWGSAELGRDSATRRSLAGRRGGRGIDSYGRYASIALLLAAAPVLTLPACRARFGSSTSRRLSTS